MIVGATLPLVAERGSAVTTQQIARAAGIGEATIFRAFEDKAELLRACMAEALRPEHLEEALAGVPRNQPLERRLTAAAQALLTHSGRIGAVIEALVASGSTLSGGADGVGRQRFMAGREAAMARITADLADLIGPDGARLRVPVETAAHAFQYFVLSLFRTPGHWAAGGRIPDDDELARVVDLFLNGALTRGDAC